MAAWMPLLLTVALASSPAFAAVADDGLDVPWGDADWDEDSPARIWSGFIEAGAGYRLGSSRLLDDNLTLGDLRARIERDWTGQRLAASFKADALYDAVPSKANARMRELKLRFTPHDNVDVKLGRQVLTWGTGDLLFLNDQFPKDWVSFFSGRDEEYLKAPSDTLRVTGYTSLFNLDVAWTPAFEPDRYLTGERFSFFSPVAGRVVAPDPPLGARLPARTLGNSEWALRAYRNIAGTEYALYGYRGFYKSPSALDDNLDPRFSRLDVYGASLRTAAGGGLVNAELAWHASRDDPGGDDPLVPNSQLRLLLGYERELIANLTLAGQAYAERTAHRDRLLASSAAPRFAPEEWRSLLTLRLTYRTLQDKLTWSVFGFYSPTDTDFHLRPRLEYRYSDAWTLTGGLNLFGGQDDHTFFGQFDDNDNAYLRVRFNY